MDHLTSIFFCAGAADYLIGSRLGLGEAFRKGLESIIELLLLMGGFIILAPWIGAVIAPIISPLFVKIGCDPSLFAGMLLSSDGGAAVLGAQLSLTQVAGLYNGMIVGSFLGITIVCTIPLALSGVRGARRQAAVKGLLIGFLTIPVGCVLTGLLAQIPLLVIAKNTWPVLLLTVVLEGLFYFRGDQVVVIFQGLAFAVRAIALFGFAAAVVQETFRIEVLPGLTSLSIMLPIICKIGVFLAGILPLMTLLQRVLSKWFFRMGQLLHVGNDTVTGLLLSLANPIPVMGELEQMDQRGCMLSMAFLTSAGFAIGDHFAFALQFSPEIAMPLMIGKITAGFMGLLCAASPVMFQRSVKP